MLTYIIIDCHLTHMVKHQPHPQKLVTCLLYNIKVNSEKNLKVLESASVVENLHMHSNVLMITSYIVHTKPSYTLQCLSFTNQLLNILSIFPCFYILYFYFISYYTRLFAL